MQSATLGDFTAWNDQLVALAEAGVPLEVGLNGAEADAAETIERINSAVARRIGRGESLDEALEDDEPTVPAPYRSLVQTGLRSGDLSAALEGSSRLAEAADQAQYTLRAAFFYPLIVCFLAYLGIVAFCLFFVPMLESVYDGLRIPPGSGLRTLQIVRDTMPYWVAIPPIALVWFGWRELKSRRQRAAALSVTQPTWQPGTARVLHEERCANFAETVATLLENGTSLEKALRLAADASGDAQLTPAARWLAASLARGELPTDDGTEAGHFPPFLRWALWHSEPVTGRDNALRMAAGIYRQAAQRRSLRLQLATPLVISAILGGGVTLLYGLALFVPVVQMLLALAN